MCLLDDFTQVVEPWLHQDWLVFSADSMSRRRYTRELGSRGVIG